MSFQKRQVLVPLIGNGLDRRHDANLDIAPPLLL
jgi:hypothetical protein